MTDIDFVKEIQDYYGEYPKGQKKAIGKYVVKKSARELDILYEVCLLDYSTRWGKPPDIAIFEELARKHEIRSPTEIYEDNLGNIYLGDRMIGHMDSSRFIPDVSNETVRRKYLEDWEMYRRPRDFAKLLLEQDEKRQITYVETEKVQE